MPEQVTVGEIILKLQYDGRSLTGNRNRYNSDKVAEVSYASTYCS